MCLNCAVAFAPVTFLFSFQLHLKSFDFQLHLFTPQIMSPVPPSLPTNPMHPETIILPPVSFALHLQLHLLRHFEKSLPPRELHPPEDEPTEESKEAHCFCIDRLGLCWVTIVKKKKRVILETELSVFCCGRVKSCLVKALGLCKRKRRSIEVFSTAGLKGLKKKKFPLPRLRCRFDAPQ